MKLLFNLILFFLPLQVVFGQIPEYYLNLERDSLVNNTIYSFSVYAYATNENIELASLGLTLKFNASISSGGLAFTIDSGSSSLDPAQQPANSDLTVSGNELRVAAKSPPGSGSGTVLNADIRVRIGAFRLTSSVPFTTQHPNIIWKNSPDTSSLITDVKAYISGAVTDITDTLSHNSSLSNPILAPLTITSAQTRPNSTAGQPYADTLKAVDGVTPYTWSVTSGPLPAGLALSSGGVISGTATTAGTYPFTARVTDSELSSKSQSFSITVNPGSLDHFLVETSGGGNIPAQTAGIAFNIRLSARDANNNIIPDFNQTAEITSNGVISSGSGTTSAFSSGILLSRSVTITSAGGAVSITATRSGGTEYGTSNAFIVNPAAASRLSIQTEPSPGAVAGSLFASQPTLRIEDIYGNLISSNNSAAVSVARSTGTDILHGTTTVTASGGVASFIDLSYDKAETIDLLFSCPGLTSATSHSIQINPAEATKISIESRADGTGEAVEAQNLRAGYSLYVYSIARDSFNNYVSNFASSWSIVSMTGSVAETDLLANPDNKSSIFKGRFTGSGQIRSVSGTLDSGMTGTITVIPNFASRLTLIQQPTGATAGSVIAPPVSVQLQDSTGNNVDTSANIQLSLTSGTGTLGGTSSRTSAAGGLASFNDITIDKSGSKQVTASSGPLSAAVSDFFTISAGGPTHLEFSQQPVSTTAGQAISPAVAVQLRDQYENDVPSGGVAVTVSIFSGSDTLRGTKTRLTGSDGRAVFSDLVINLTGNKTVAASSTGLPDAISGTFSITPATPAEISVETANDGSGVIVPAQSVTSGSSIGLYAITRDVFGNFIANVNAAWSLDNPQGGVTGSDLVSFDGGRYALFTGHASGTASVVASAASLTEVKSGLLTVVAGSARRIEILQQPGNAIAGDAISPPVTVQLKDSLGNNAPIPGVSIQVSLSGTGSLGGTISRTTNSDGLAAFSDLSVNLTGTKRLIAASGSLIPDTSGQFTISPASPSRLRFVQQPANDTAGTVLNPSVAVQVQDFLGNDVPISGENISVSLFSGTGTLAGTLTKATNSAGTATFDDLIINQTGDKTLQASHNTYGAEVSSTFSLTGFTITASAGLHGSIFPSGTLNYIYGDSQTFNVTPDPGYHTSDVAVDGSARGAISSYTFSNISANHTISAAFLVDTLTITASSGPNGSVSPGGAVRVTYGSNQTFSFTPGAGYHVNSITVDDTVRPAAPSWTFLSVVRNHTISVTFVPDSLSITASNGANGSISPSGVVRVGYGNNQAFAILAIPGYHIYDVQVDGFSAGRIPSYTFLNVQNNHTITALFAIDTLTITSASGAHGAISPSGDVKVLYGADQTFTITPETGYHVLNVVRNGISLGPRDSVTFTNVTSNGSISASFAINSYSITAAAGANGTITPSGSLQYNYGSTVSFAMRPGLGYHIDSVIVDGAYAGTDTLFIFPNINANHTISVAFRPNILSVTVGTNFPGLGFSVDGVPYTSQQTFAWTAGESHIISTDSIQPGTAGTRYLWNSWSDGGNIARSVAPLVSASYLALFSRQHFLTMIANPGGTVTPPSGWIASGQPVTITAAPDSGYNFDIWSGSGTGSYSGTANPRSITVSGPISETANFVHQPVQIVINTNPQGRTVSLDGSAPLTAPATRTWAYYSEHIIATQSPQPVNSSTQYVWRGWSDGGTQTHTIFVNTDSSFTADFGLQYYLTMNTGPGGTITPSPGYRDSGASVLIKAVPAEGFMFSSWTGTGTGSYTGSTDSAVILIGGPITETAAFVTDTLLISASAGIHGTISPSGEIRVPYGSGRSFTITADSIYHISDVVVDGSSVGPVSSYIFSNVTRDHSIVASFTLNGYTVTATAGPNGTISPSGPIPVDYGSDLDFAITPNTGYHIDSVFIDGGYIGAPAECSFNSITANHTLYAKFAIDQIAINATSGEHGAVSPSGTVNVNYGSSRTFTFLPDTGYHVDSVTVDSQYQGSPLSYTFTGITVPHSIHVTFAINRYRIIAFSGVNGIVTPPDTSFAYYGDSIVYRIVPETGYHTSSLLVDGIPAGRPETYTFRGINSDHTISAAFSINRYTITSSSGPYGTVLPEGTIAFDHGTDQHYSFRPNTGYRVDSVFIDGAYAGRDTGYTFGAITADHTVHVVFRANFYIVNVRTVPDSLQVSVDGMTYASPVEFSWNYNSVHAVAAIDTQNSSAFSRHLFTGWSDGKPKSHNLLITGDSSFSAAYKSQFYLAVNMDSGGIVTPSSGWQDSGRIVSIRAYPSAGFKFSHWEGTGAGSYSDTLNPVSIVMNSPVTQKAVFTRFPVRVNIQTVPAGLTIVADGVPYTSPQSFQWPTGSEHTVAVFDTQATSPGVRYIWNRWSDNAGKSHTVLPLNDTTFTAYFAVQYRLTMNANTGGTITPQSGWFNRGQTVTITAAPEPGYTFTTWSGRGSGSVTGVLNPADVTMNEPVTETANFTRKPVLITIATNPAGRIFTFNGTTYTAAQTVSVIPGTKQTIGTSSPQPGLSSGMQWSWSGWSDGGQMNHDIYPVSDSAFTAGFSIQYALTTSADPAEAGTVSPAGRRFFDLGDSVTVTATPTPGYLFTGWSGAAVSEKNPVKIYIDGAKSLTASFSRAVRVVMTSTPSGRKVTADDSGYTTPKTLYWLPGSVHKIGTVSPQSDTAGVQHSWSGWDDGGDTVHYVSPATDTAFNARFSTRYYLTTTSGSGGTVLPSSGWHDRGDTVSVSAVPDADHIFSSWTGSGPGSYSGTDNPAEIIILNPVAEAAAFGQILPSPVLAGIPDGASGVPTDPVLLWFRYPGATSYCILVSKDSTFSDTDKTVYSNQALTDTMVQLAGLANLQAYYWRLFARVGIDVTEYSRTNSFTTLNATIAVTSPPYSWATGYTYNIGWTATDLSGRVNVSVTFDSGRTYYVIRPGIENSGFTYYTIPDLPGTIDSCRVRVESALNSVIGGTSGIFSIVPGGLPAEVRLYSSTNFPAEPSSSTDYRLFGVPGTSDTIHMGLYPMGQEKVDWRMFADNGAAENYLVELSPGSTLRTGEGYWLVKKGTLDIPGFDMKMPALNADASYDISLHPGWNIISNPFDKNVPWPAVAGANNLGISAQLFGYQGSYLQTGMMEPFKGYYFFNGSDLASLRMPYPFGRTNYLDQTPEVSWKIRLTFESEINSDPENFIGIAPGAKAGIDQLDGHKPPLFLDQGFLYFDRPEWDNIYQKFNSDFRPSLGEGQVWEFSVENPRGSKCTIRFDGIDQVPKGYKIFLVNEMNSTPEDLRKKNSYAYQTVSGIMPFRIIIGKETFTEEELAKTLPSSFELAQNFPNPFNSSTSIRVELPEESDIHLAVYDIVGKEIFTLAENRYPPGTHTFSWDGTDLRGNQASSGVYFIRLVGNGKSVLTRKMIMIK